MFNHGFCGVCNTHLQFYVFDYCFILSPFIPCAVFDYCFILSHFLLRVMFDYCFILSHFCYHVLCLIVVSFCLIFVCHVFISFDLWSIFLTIQTDVNRKFRMHDRLTKEHSGPFSNGRSVFARVPLTQGRYCIIPSTFEPGKIGKFVLRMYSTLDMELR